jgi:hypothetical protein
MPGAGAAGKGNCPFEGEREAKAALAAGAGKKRKSAGAFCRRATLPECLPKVSLTFLVVSPPDWGRRVRYGKLRFPSCTPFHPPGAPLPFCLATRRIPTPHGLWERPRVSAPVGSFFRGIPRQRALPRKVS